MMTADQTNDDKSLDESTISYLTMASFRPRFPAVHRIVFASQAILAASFARLISRTAYFAPVDTISSRVKRKSQPMAYFRHD
jgi:hypothetical protein